MAQDWGPMVYTVLFAICCYQLVSFYLETSGPGSHARLLAALRLRSGQAWEPPLLGFPDKNC